MVLLKFNGVRTPNRINYFGVEDCKNLPINKVTLNNKGLSTVWKGNKFLGHANVHPEVLIRELGWSL